MTKKKERKRNKKSKDLDNLTLFEYIRYRRKTRNYGYDPNYPKSNPAWRVRNCIWYKVEKVLFLMRCYLCCLWVYCLHIFMEDL